MGRIWRTADGRHVADGHVDAAFLAYGEDDDVPDKVAAEVEGDDEPKRGRRPADKAKPRPADKGGLRVDTAASLRREAEDLGVTVDRRWGTDRLRQEIDAARQQKATPGG